MTVDLPRYCVIGSRPVKAVRTPDGGMDILAFDWQTGEFRREMGYLTCITFGEDADREISALDVEFLTEEAFVERVERLRKEAGLS